MIEYNTSDWLLRHSCRGSGSAVPHALSLAIPSALLGLALVILRQTFPGFKYHTDLPVFQSTAWAALVMPLSLLIAFRTRQAMGRFWEGNGLLHAMRGEWFDSASCLVTFTVPAKSTKPKEVREFRHTLVRLMSLCHGSALDEIKSSQSESYEVLDLSGLSEETMNILRDCKDQDFNRVEVILHMIQVLVIKAMQEGVIDVPAPILSRVYQTLSRGFVNLLNARKLKDTKFPFPYTQIISIFLLVFTILTPCVIATIVESKLWCPVFTFLPVFALLSLNYIAGKLEMPFGDDVNDLPLGNFQSEMNASLLMFIHENSDHVAKTRMTCRRSFSSLKGPVAEYSNIKRGSIFSKDYSFISEEDSHSELNEVDSLQEYGSGPEVARVGGLPSNQLKDCPLHPYIDKDDLPPSRQVSGASEPGILKRLNLEDDRPPSRQISGGSDVVKRVRFEEQASFRFQSEDQESEVSHLREPCGPAKWEVVEENRKLRYAQQAMQSQMVQTLRQQQLLQLPQAQLSRRVEDSACIDIKDGQEPVPDERNSRGDRKDDEEQPQMPLSRRLFLPLLSLLQPPAGEAETQSSTAVPATLGERRSGTPQEGSMWC